MCASFLAQLCGAYMHDMYVCMYMNQQTHSSTHSSTDFDVDQIILHCILLKLAGQARQLGGRVSSSHNGARYSRISATNALRASARSPQAWSGIAAVHIGRHLAVHATGSQDSAQHVDAQLPRRCQCSVIVVLRHYLEKCASCCQWQNTAQTLS